MDKDFLKRQQAEHKIIQDLLREASAGIAAQNNPNNQVIEHPTSSYNTPSQLYSPDFDTSSPYNSRSQHYYQNQPLVGQDDNQDHGCCCVLM